MEINFIMGKLELIVFPVEIRQKYFKFPMREIIAVAENHGLRL